MDHVLRAWVCPGPGVRQDLRPDEVYVVRVESSGRNHIVVERAMNVPTLEEARAHEPEDRQAMFDELTRWHELGGFQRVPRHGMPSARVE